MLVKSLLCAGIIASFAAGCGSSTSGTTFAVGDCVSRDVNQNGEVEKLDCSSTEAFEVDELAGNGARPDCGYPFPGGAAYITDAVSQVTYCGANLSAGNAE